MLIIQLETDITDKQPDQHVSVRKGTVIINAIFPLIIRYTCSQYIWWIKNQISEGSIIQLFNNNVYLISIHPNIRSDEKIRVMSGSSEETNFGLLVANRFTEMCTGSIKVLVSDDNTVTVEKRGDDIFRLVEDVPSGSEKTYPPYDDMPVMRINFSCGIKETLTAEALVIGNTKRI